MKDYYETQTLLLDGDCDLASCAAALHIAECVATALNGTFGPELA